MYPQRSVCGGDFQRRCLIIKLKWHLYAYDCLHRYVCVCMCGCWHMSVHLRNYELKVNLWMWMKILHNTHTHIYIYISTYIYIFIFKFTFLYKCGCMCVSAHYFLASFVHFSVNLSFPMHTRYINMYVCKNVFVLRSALINIWYTYVLYVRVCVHNKNFYFWNAITAIACAQIDSKISLFTSQTCGTWA